MALQINSNKINPLISLLFPGRSQSCDSRAGVRVCRDFTEISTHYSNTARIFNRRSDDGCRRVH